MLSTEGGGQTNAYNGLQGEGDKAKITCLCILSDESISILLLLQTGFNNYDFIYKLLHSAGSHLNDSVTPAQRLVGY